MHWGGLQRDGECDQHSVRDGRLYIASVMSGGIDVVDLRTGACDFIPTGGEPLNLLFQHKTLLIADGGTRVAGADIASGQLIRIDVGTTGIALYTGRISPAGSLAAPR